MAKNIAHGTTITYKDIDKSFPERRELFDCNTDIENIRKELPIYFFPFDTISEDYSFQKEYDNGYVGYQREYQLIMSGITTQGLKITVILEHRPFVLIRVPDDLIDLDVVLHDADPGHALKVVTDFRNKISTIIKSLDIRDHVIDSVCRRFFRGEEFQYYKGYYIKVDFRTLSSRRKLINFIHSGNFSKSILPDKTIKLLESGIETAYDDVSNYHLLVCRELGFDLCGWNEIKKYKTVECNLTNSSIPTEWGSLNSYFLLRCQKLTRKELDIERKSLTIYWDIECLRYKEDGLLPDPKVKEDEVFVIGLYVANTYTGQEYGRIGLVKYKSANSDDSLTIHCKTEKKLILAFFKIINKIKPEFIMGYNDGNFDWPFIIGRAVYYQIFDRCVEIVDGLFKPFNFDNDYESRYILSKLGISKNCNSSQRKYVNNIAYSGTNYGTKTMFNKNNDYNYNVITGRAVFNHKSKLESGLDIEWTTLKVFGITGCDLLVIMRIVKKNPERYTLEYFLECYGVPPKQDMPISDLFRIGRRHKLATMQENLDSKKDIDEHFNLPEFLTKIDLDENDLNEMKRVKDYCIYDAQACCSLMNNVKFVRDRQIIGSMSYVGVKQALLQADGIKLRNLLMYKARKDYSIIYTTHFNNESVKFPGAYVVPPKRGMQMPKLSLPEKIACREYKHPYYSTRKYYLCDDAIKFGQSIIGSLADYYSHETGEKREQLLMEFTKDKQIEFLREKIKSAEWCKCCDIEQIVHFWSETGGRPVSALDFASLYPSIMMVYNLSKETIIKNPEHLDYLKQKNVPIQEVQFDYLHKGENRIKSAVAHFVRHSYDPEDKSADRIEKGFGVLPSLLLDLKQDRKKYKKEQKEIEEEIAEREKTGATFVRDKFKDKSIADLKLAENYFNAKQNAVKVFMNSFYGQCGSDISMMFLFELAGGVTSQGQKNLKLVISTIEKLGSKVLYGDTDSAYLQTPEQNYLEFDISYYSGKIDKVTYCQEQIRVNVRDTLILQKKIAETLERDNGTKFLTMEFEESLFPVVLVAKKNYFGIQHAPPSDLTKPFVPCMNVPKKPFMRGQAAQKRGMPNIAKNLTMTLVKSSIDIHLNKSILYLVEEYFDNLYSGKMANKLEDFIITATYNNAKKNVKVTNFVKRMEREYGLIIKSAEKFQFVFVDRPLKTFDYNGKTLEERTLSDKMEFPDTLTKLSLKIDAAQYFETYLKGILAQFVSTDASFNGNTPKEIMASAKAYVVEINYKYAPRERKSNDNKKIYRSVRDTIKSKKIVPNYAVSKKHDVAKLVEHIKHEYSKGSERFANRLVSNLSKYSNAVYRDFLQSGYIDRQIAHFTQLVNNKMSDLLELKLEETANNEDLIKKIIMNYRKEAETNDDIKKSELQEVINNVITNTKAELDKHNCEVIKFNKLTHDLKIYLVLIMQYEYIKRVLTSGHTHNIYNLVTKEDILKELSDIPFELVENKMCENSQESDLSQFVML